MIAPQELRLGNWININGNPFQLELPDFNLIVNKNGKSTYDPVALLWEPVILINKTLITWGYE